MASRCDRIIIEWTADFRRPGSMKIDLTPEDQDDPRLLALVAWWEEREQARSAAARQANSGDPFTGT